MRCIHKFQFIILILQLTVFCVGCLLIGINHIYFHEQGSLFFGSAWQRVIGPAILLNAAVLYWQHHLTPRVRLVVYIFSAYVLSLAAGLVLTQGIQYTPFSIIDSYLIVIDHALGFNMPALLAWVAQHSYLQKVCIWAYNSLVIEMSILPLLMALLVCERATKAYLCALLVSYLVGTAIYYFFPTTAPASMFHSSHFFAAQYDTYLKFYELRHHFILSASDGGLIAFPSFHVVWGSMLICLVYEKKWLFYPVLIWNTILILSTMLLGWHYLTDVIAGLIIGLGSYRVAIQLINATADTQTLQQLS